MNKKILFLVLLSVILVFPFFASAVTANEIVTNIATALKNIVLTLTIIGFLIAGLLYLTATGSPARVETAKKMAFAAIVGTVLYILATIAKDILSNVLLNGS